MLEWTDPHHNWFLKFSRVFFFFLVFFHICNEPWIYIFFFCLCIKWLIDWPIKITWAVRMNPFQLAVINLLSSSYQVGIPENWCTTQLRVSAKTLACHVRTCWLQNLNNCSAKCWKRINSGPVKRFFIFCPICNVMTPWGRTHVIKVLFKVINSGMYK